MHATSVSYRPRRRTSTPTIYAPDRRLVYSTSPRLNSPSVHIPWCLHLERTQHVDPVEATFSGLRDIWIEETQLTSSMTSTVMHPAYQKIIGMGERVVPYILRDLRDHPRYWMWALASITQEDPVPEDAHGDLRRMSGAWLTWGRERGYI